VIAPDGLDWIDHDGGSCPLPPETLVQVRFRDGMYSVQQPGATAGYWDGYGSACGSCWQHDLGGPDGSDIVAYRVLEASK